MNKVSSWHKFVTLGLFSFCVFHMWLSWWGKLFSFYLQTQIQKRDGFSFFSGTWSNCSGLSVIALVPVRICKYLKIVTILVCSSFSTCRYFFCYLKSKVAQCKSQTSYWLGICWQWKNLWCGIELVRMLKWLVKGEIGIFTGL